MKDKG